jgi:HNH endonuclease
MNGEKMNETLKGVAFYCYRCEREFVPRFVLRDKPTNCALCSSRHWSRPRKVPHFGKCFETLIAITAKATNKCIEWPFAQDGHGYGVIHDIRQKRIRKAYAVSFELHNGISVSEGMEVCHNCPDGDNKLCINPRHLFMGTHQNNMQDAADKGLMAKGTEMPNAKLNDDKIRQIRSIQGITNTEIARRFGIAHQYVTKILRREVWKHVQP